jgi:hypothetical protein
MADKMKENPENLPLLGRKLLWLDNKNHVRKLIFGLYVTCALLFLADFFYKKKTYLDLEDIPGFYAVYGFGMCVIFVLCARALRSIVARDVTYYGSKDVQAEEYPEEGLSRETLND